ncbi:ABC transporter permease subunit [Candidatus Comchoanobacter bicostacola]|uniref:ABC transporter permease subunit n=1 Tax=Candidatus Comchoanobacter bicostacola TaxID=2919598 RepID=A0ABY5DLT3_9GAMM|nr:ABC transporter permease subunit [Candidatus Comchoanobacter bicostacola]UTC24589.1 ABC transporter permease subunit [Candidatus Comchoanobacter bicostacola]
MEIPRYQRQLKNLIIICCIVFTHLTLYNQLVGDSTDATFTILNSEPTSSLRLFWDTITLQHQYSYFKSTPIAQLIAQALGQSLSLVFLISCIVYSLTIILGTLLFFRNLRILNYLILCIGAMPSTLLVCLYMFLIQTHHNSWLSIPSNHLSLVVLISLKYSAKYIQIFKTMLRIEYKKTYIKFLTGLGTSPYIIFIRFAAKNALFILIKQSPVRFVKMMFSILIFESILNTQGMGSLFIHALLTKDTPLFTSCVLIYSILSTVSISRIQYHNNHAIQ